CRVIQQSAVAFRNGFELGYEVRKLLDVPAANITKNALPFLASLARSLSILVGVVVVAGGSVAEPGESCQALALGQHIAGHARLAGSEGIGEHVALEFGDTWPVLHVEVFFRCRDLLIIRRQGSDGALKVTDRR